LIIDPAHQGEKPQLTTQCQEKLWSLTAFSALNSIPYLNIRRPGKTQKRRRTPDQLLKPSCDRQTEAETDPKLPNQHLWILIAMCRMKSPAGSTRCTENCPKPSQALRGGRERGRGRGTNWRTLRQLPVLQKYGEKCLLHLRKEKLPCMRRKRITTLCSSIAKLRDNSH
jgi:hypothetical protein